MISCQYASNRYRIQFRFSDITVQHLAECFAHKGGKGKLGKKHSAEACAKQREAMKGKNRGKLTADRCAKISEAMKGKNIAHRGGKVTADHRAKISEAMKGKKHSADACSKISTPVLVKHEIILATICSLIYPI